MVSPAEVPGETLSPPGQMLLVIPLCPVQLLTACSAGLFPGSAGAAGVAGAGEEQLPHGTEQGD